MILLNSQRGTCLCVTFAVFLFSLLAHVVSLPSTALRLWWVKENCVILFDWCPHFKLSNSPHCSKAFKSALSEVFLCVFTQSWCVDSHIFTSTPTYKYQSLFPCISKCSNQHRKNQFLLENALSIPTANWCLVSEKLFLWLFFLASLLINRLVLLWFIKSKTHLPLSQTNANNCCGSLCLSPFSLYFTGFRLRCIWVVRAVNIQPLGSKKNWLMIKETCLLWFELSQREGHTAEVWVKKHLQYDI